MVAEDNVSWTLNNVRIRYSSLGPRKKVIENYIIFSNILDHQKISWSRWFLAIQISQFPIMNLTLYICSKPNQQFESKLGFQI